MIIAGGRAEVNVDVSRALATCHELGQRFSRDNFNKVLTETVKDTGRRGVKKIVKQEIPKEYAVTQSWVGRKVMAPRMGGGGGGAVSCSIPIKGERGVLGGIFAASGGGVAKGRAKRNGKALKRLKKKKRDIKALILLGKMSDIPGALPNQGGNPPFRLSNGVVATRTTTRRGPLARVVGRAVPQMVDKHFEDRLEPELNDYMEKRFQENAERFFGD